MTQYDEEIWKKICNLKVINENGCWIHPNWKTNSRPQLTYKYKTWLLSRLVLKLTDPSFNETLYANHKDICKNQHCFNPEHLYSGTAQDNVWDAIEAGVFVNNFKKPWHTGTRYCQKGHEMILRKNGLRRCLVCAREYSKEYERQHPGRKR